ncbi:MAG: hypothetical protein NVS2B12_24760 [Ktedonobacteraceae bacterium]
MAYTVPNTTLPTFRKHVLSSVNDANNAASNAKGIPNEDYLTFGKRNRDDNGPGLS